MIENHRMTEIKETVNRIQNDREKLIYLDSCAEDWNTNCKTKFFPDGSTNTVYCSSRFVFKDKEINDIYSNALHSVKIKDICDEYGCSPELAEIYLESIKLDAKEKVEQKKVKRHNSDRERDDVIKRARDRCFDIARLNQFNYFITVTFKGSEYEFENPIVIMKMINKYLANKVQRQGLQYLLIPERHKKNGIHCHALVNDIDIVDSGTVLVEGYNKPIKLETALKRHSIIRQTVYNIPSWKYGWSTAIKIDGSNAFSYYVTKYITKGNKKIFGKYFWSSRNLIREPEIVYHNVDYDSINRSEFNKCGAKYKYNSNSFFVPDFEKISSKFNDISSFLDYIYSDEYKKEYEKYEQTRKNRCSEF